MARHRVIELKCAYCGRELHEETATTCGGCGAPLKRKQLIARRQYQYDAWASGFEPSYSAYEGEE